jgi:peroxiredoxin
MYMPLTLKSLNTYKLSTSQSVILITLFLCSVMINVLLARKASSLTSAILTLKSEGRLAIGAIAPPIALQELDGKSVTISFSQSTVPTVLYVFSPQCTWCTRNLQNIRSLASSIQGKYRILGLSLSSSQLDEYMMKNNLPFSVYKSIDENSKKTYKLGATPQTLVISPESKVIKNWYGVFSNDQQKDMEEFFATKLPGVSDAQ